MEISNRQNNKNSIPQKAKHANPLYLNYYLFGDTNFENKFKIIDKKLTDTLIGKLEIAIIAESHYIMLDNVFTELLSCSDNIKIPSIPIKKQSSPRMQFSYKFNSFLYSTSIYNKEFADDKIFKKEEQKIATQKNLLFHFFEKNTALTSIILKENSNQRCIIETCHSYPDFNTIVYSKTEFSSVK